MRPLLTIALMLTAAAPLAGCVTTSKQHPGQVQTTNQAERESVEGAAEAPLRDFNLLRTKIPPVLLEAMSDPYYRPPEQLTCEEIEQLIEPLDMALGPDLDTPKDKEGMGHRGRQATLGLVAGAASSAVPFHSWIRRLSGAERHDAYVQAAITAGGIRRGYLKGLGEAHGCLPPATPSHVLTGAPMIDQALKPRYPTRLAPAPGAEAPPSDPPR